MIRTKSLFAFCLTLIQLLALKAPLVSAFSSQKSAFIRTLRMTASSSNDSVLPRRQMPQRENNERISKSVNRTSLDMTSSSNDNVLPRRQMLEREKKEWISRSVDYYSKVMREERRRNEGQVPADFDKPEYQQEYQLLAKKHYFAIQKVKVGKLNHAEQIYRRIIDELLQEEDGECDHAKLAVTTLLLALLMQLLDNDGTDECACSAKVLCAYALFEMRQGNARKAYELVKTAIRFDRTLTPVLQWKQFRDVATQTS